jgi:hypothetical protein
MKIGKAGELRVASELLLRGFQPSLTLEINEVDIILNTGIKIQVKSSHITEKGYYTFSFKGWKRDSRNNRKQEKHQLTNTDFVILFAINENSFFIIPADKIRERFAYTLNYHPDGKRRGVNWELLTTHKNQWDLLRFRR